MKRSKMFWMLGVALVLLSMAMTASAMTMQLSSGMIKLGKPGKLSTDSFKFAGIFTADGGPVDLTLVPVTIGMNGYSQTLPAGSFKKDKKGLTFKYSSKAAGINMVMLSYKTGKFQFSAKGVSLTAGGDPSTVQNPVELSIDPGIDVGCLVVHMTPSRTGLQLKAGKTSLTEPCASDVQFQGAPSANPDAIFVNETSSVRFTQAIVPNPDLDPSKVLLTEVSAGAISPTLMYDDGNLSHGDDIQGDGVYSCIVPLTAASEGTLSFRVEAGTVGSSQKSYSEPRSLPVITHLTTEQVNTAINLADSAKAAYDAEFAGNGGDMQAALAAVLAQLNSNPSILQSGMSDSGRGLWWINTDGTLGAMSVYDTGDTLGGERGLKASALPDLHLKDGLEGVGKYVAPDAEESAAADATKVGSKKALVFGAFFYAQVVGAIETILKNSQCPKYDVTTVGEGNCSVDFFKTLHEYGIIAGVTHGETFYNGILSWWSDKWGWNYIGGQVVYFTNSTLTDGNKANYETDIKMGRLAVYPGGMLAVLPSFISYYNKGFPDSLVYIAACRSSYNNSMANAFLNSGVKTFFGYSEYVLVTFAGQAGTALFTELVNNAKTTGEAFVPGQCDGQATPACFDMRGDNKLAISDTDLLNGGFEKGNLNGWSKSGDGRVIAQLGGTMPTEGSFMGIISTGLGFTTSSGAVSQSVCVPTVPQGKTKMTLKYDWNFFSEEFLEWCGSQYQDFFSVNLFGTSLQYNNVDSLCGSVSASDVSFDKGGVYNTGWRSQSVDVTAQVGQSGSLTFSAGDVGDSIYDTAILIDNVRFEAE